MMSHFELKFIVVVYDAGWYLAVTKIDSCRLDRVILIYELDDVHLLVVVSFPDSLT